jgi:hypothetical protein
MRRGAHVTHIDGDEVHVPVRHCAKCFGLAWRVIGPRCDRCGLEHAEERIELDPAARVVDQVSEYA